MLSDGKQIAAARQLLGWSQGDLAEKSGVSKPSIIRIEKDLMSVKDDIRQLIINSFTKENIEFIDNGTRINNKIVHVIEGQDCYLKLLENAHEELSLTGGEYLKSGVDERRSGLEVVKKLTDMRNSGIKFRSLIKNQDNFMRGPLEEYRWLDDSLYVESDVKIIYSNKVCYLMTWYSSYRVIIIQDDKIAEENKRIFNYIWNNSKIPFVVEKMN